MIGSVTTGGPGPGGVRRVARPGATRPGRGPGRGMVAARLMAGVALAGVALSACSSSGGSAGPAAQGGCPSGVAEVTVHGHGSVEGPPDLLTVSLGVQTQAATATAALADNSRLANSLLAQLKKHGVAEADMQTSGLSIQPVYGENRPVITGYQVTNTVTVRLSDLSAAGSVVDDAAGAVGDAVRVDQIAFSVRDDSALSHQAVSAAVHRAADRARAMAGAAGRSLGRLCSMTDTTSKTTPVPLDQVGAGAALAAPSTPVQAGTEEVTADVTAVYELGR